MRLWISTLEVILKLNLLLHFNCFLWLFENILERNGALCFLFFISSKCAIIRNLLKKLIQFDCCLSDINSICQMPSLWMNLKIPLSQFIVYKFLSLAPHVKTVQLNLCFSVCLCDLQCCPVIWFTVLNLWSYVELLKMIIFLKRYLILI